MTEWSRVRNFGYICFQPLEACFGCCDSRLSSHTAILLRDVRLRSSPRHVLMRRWLWMHLIFRTSAGLISLYLWLPACVDAALAVDSHDFQNFV